MEPVAVKPHVRPRVRSRGKKEQSSAPNETPSDGSGGGSSASIDLDQLVEETRGRLSSGLTLDESKGDSKSTSNSLRISQSPAEPSSSDPSSTSSTTDALMPASILKTPKYTNNATATATNKNIIKVKVPSEPTLLQELENAYMKETAPETTNKRAVMEFVVERDASQVKPQPMPQGIMDPRAVEGYVPQMENNNDIVISSLSELMEKTGMLPDQNSDDPQVVEANLEFSVMSSQQFEEERQQQEEDDEPLDQPAEVFQGRFDVFSDDDDSGASYLHHKAEDGDDYWSDSDDDRVQTMPPSEPRAFMKLWDALSEWITPEAVDMLTGWYGDDDDAFMEMSHSDWAPIVDTSEIAASRCAGIMALLNMHFQRGMKELDQPPDVERGAKHRMADLLRTFNYSRATARLDTKMWRAMTCVLLEIVLALKNDKSSDPPASAKAIGITPDEYYYLTQTCFRSLAAGTMEQS